MKKTKTLISFLALILTALTLISCSGGKKASALSRLCENLRGTYVCELSFRSEGQGQALEGTAELSHSATLSELKILSPDPLSGMKIQYDTLGAPSSVAVHFEGIDTTLPAGALTKINRIAALAADDFVSILSKTSADMINEYDVSEDETGCFVIIPYDGAEITVCFAEDGEEPYSLEYVSDGISASVLFTDFEKIYEESED